MDGEPKWRVGRERKTSYEEDKEATLVRQRRMEGQVRGLRQMVRDDRYHLEVVRQINARTAPSRRAPNAEEVLAERFAWGRSTPRSIGTG
ncbi:MAG TPA: metal-sensing transcriptional repressor [Chloroflexota bacterium]|nr:metal-sensing transcriptional repressor [Chloroflexota bacterium]